MSAKKGHIRPLYKCNICEELKDQSELYIVEDKYNTSIVIFRCIKEPCSLKTTLTFAYCHLFEDDTFVPIDNQTLQYSNRVKRQLRQINNERKKGEKRARTTDVWM